MKWFLILALFAPLSAVYAHEGEGTGDFAKDKEEWLGHLDKHISALQDVKTCVSGATSKEALKPCHEKMMAMHKEMKMDRMDHKMEHMEKHMEQMKEKKAKMEEKKGG